MLKVDEWRRAKEITQKEMAKALGISLPTYLRLEKNPGEIKIKDAFKMAEILDVNFNDIIFLPSQSTKCGLQDTAV